jgi:hypothetical protein
LYTNFVVHVTCVIYKRCLEDINSGVVPTNCRVKTTSKLLEQLDVNVKPGITAGQFSTLFSQCAECGLVTTRRVFEEHKCRDEIIDLTGDS